MQQNKSRIYFTCPTDTIKSNYPVYEKIINYIRFCGGVITYDWVKSAFKEIKTGVEKDSYIYNQHKMSGINSADLVIAEMSEKSIGVIHQITIALIKSKPVLLLLPEKNNKKDQINAIKSPWLTQKTYHDLDEIKLHINNFINLNSTKKRHRINLVISSAENECLEITMKNTHETKTSIIRSLIRKHACSH